MVQAMQNRSAMQSAQNQPAENLESVLNRYDRQQLIDGWKQEKLTDAKIAIIGSDALTHYLAITTAALGFGHIEIFGSGFVSDGNLSNHRKNERKPDYSEGFLYFDSAAGDGKAQAVSDFIKKLNPLVDSFAANIDISRCVDLSILGTPDIIFEATNNPASKLAAVEYCNQKKIPLISISSSEQSSAIGIYSPRQSRTDQKKFIENIIFPEYLGKKQGTTTSQFIAALATDEARKCLMPIKKEKVMDDIVVYDMHSDKRFDFSTDRNLNGEDDFSGKTVIMVGAGALGNFAGMDYVLNNVDKLYIIDFDTVESTNLNRQVWFYDAIGQVKSKALARKLKRINPRVEIITCDDKIIPEAESFFAETSADLLCDTVDNNKTRALLNYFSLKYKIPFISGGTKYDSGQVIVSIPGETACLNCQADIDQLALSGSQATQSCIYAAQPSVITSNQLIGALMVGEAKTIMNREKYGNPIKHVLKYVSGEQYRVAALPSQEACECYKDKKLQKRWFEKMGHLYVD
jgi:molybdopterin-synthase adenylyltransferase